MTSRERVSTRATGTAAFTRSSSNYSWPWARDGVHLVFTSLSIAWCTFDQRGLWRHNPQGGLHWRTQHEMDCVLAYDLPLTSGKKIPGSSGVGVGSGGSDTLDISTVYS